jgi:hypothetical protein
VLSKQPPAAVPGTCGRGSETLRNRAPLEADRDRGSATARQRLLVRLAVLEDLAGHGELPELQRVAEQVGRALRARWPEVADSDRAQEIVWRFHAGTNRLGVRWMLAA